MSLFFSLEETLQPFEESRHARHDALLFEATLTQKENQPAEARLLVKKDPALLTKTWGMLAKRLTDGRVVCLFRGRLQPVEHQGDDLWTLVLRAVGDQDALQKKALLVAHKTSPFYDPLLISERLENNPDVVRLTQPVSFYTDRVLLDTSLSSLFEGRQTHDVTPFASNIEITQTQVPPARLSLTLKAEWIQTCHGCLNVTPNLRRLSSDGALKTLTGDSLEKSWPQAGHTLGRSGYWVAGSRLEKVAVRPHLLEKSTPASKKTPRVLQETHFDPFLLLGWQVKQKRQESVTFHVDHKHQKAPHGPSKAITISLKRRLAHAKPDPFWVSGGRYEKGDCVQAKEATYVCLVPHTAAYLFQQDVDKWEAKERWENAVNSAKASSFFLTDRGKKTWGVALEMARTELARHARCVQVSFVVPLDAFPSLTTQDSVVLHHPKLSAQPLKGKIVHYRMVWNGQTGEESLHVVAACSPGLQPDAALEREEVHDTYCTDYADAYTVTDGEYLTSPSGLMCDLSNLSEPEDAFSSLFRSTFPVHVSLSNGLREQCAKLNQASGTNKLMGTRLSLKAKSLSSQDVLTHHMEIKTPVHWHSPADITL